MGILHTDIQIHFVSPHIFSSWTFTQGLQNHVVMRKIERLQVIVPLHYQSRSMSLYFLILALDAILSNETALSNRIRRVRVKSCTSENGFNVNIHESGNTYKSGNFPLSANLVYES